LLEANIIPYIDNQYFIGNTNNKIKEVFLTNTTFTSNHSNITNVTLSGITFSNQLVDTSNNNIYAEGNVVHDFNSGAIFYHSNINTNFTANFTNIPEINNKIISISIVLQQHANAYLANAIQINNLNVPVKYINGKAPTGTASNINLQNFTLIRNNNQWIVLSSLNAYL
jgi:hypothetical protein